MSFVNKSASSQLHPPITKTPIRYVAPFSGNNPIQVKPKTDVKFPFKKGYIFPYNCSYKISVLIHWENKASGAGSGGSRNLGILINDNPIWLDSRQNIKSSMPFPQSGILPATGKKGDVVHIVVKHSGTTALNIVDFNILVEAV